MVAGLPPSSSSFNSHLTPRTSVTRGASSLSPSLLQDVAGAVSESCFGGWGSCIIISVISVGDNGGDSFRGSCERVCGVSVVVCVCVWVKVVSCLS